MLDLLYPAAPAPLYKGCKRSKAVEMLLVVDEHGSVLAQVSRDFCHNSPDRPLHPVVHLHIINRCGNIYLQRRGAHKKLLPLYWDTAVGGHVAYGEYVLEALYRESAEELGLHDFLPQELVNVFAAVGDYAVRPDPDELAGGRFWTPEEIGQAIGTGILTPNFEGEYLRIKDALQALL